MEISSILDKMTIPEKIRAMEIIWDDLCRNADSLTSPDWHEQILRDREKNVKNGSEEIIDWEKAKKKIRNSI